MPEPIDEAYRGPLTGVRVLDLTRVLAGPFATNILADMGADVIKVEERAGDISRQAPPIISGVSSHFVNLNRNKKSIVIDLKLDAGKQLLLDLVRVSDV